MRLSQSPVPVPIVPHTAAPRWRRLWAMLRPWRFGGRITYAAAPSSPVDDGLVVGVIDDPELAMRLLSVRGQVTQAALATLATAFSEVRDCSRLHLDLTDAEFSDPSVTTALAGLLDQLDDRRVHLRIVGLGRLATLPVD